MLDLARINCAILYKEVTGEKLPRKVNPLSLVAEMQQIFMNAGATFEGTDDDMEFQEVSALKKIITMLSETVYKNNKDAETCYKCKKQTCGKCTSKV